MESLSKTSIIYTRLHSAVDRVQNLSNIDVSLAFISDGIFDKSFHPSRQLRYYYFRSTRMLLFHILLLIFILQAYLLDEEMSKLLRLLFYELINLLEIENEHDYFQWVRTYHKILDDINIDLDKHLLPFNQQSNGKLFGPIEITTIQDGNIAYQNYQNTLYEGQTLILKGNRNTEIRLLSENIIGVAIIEHQAAMNEYITAICKKPKNFRDQFIVFSTCGIFDRLSRLFLNRMHRQFGFPMFLLRDADTGGIINCNLLRCGNQILSYNKYITIPLSCTGTCYEAGESQPNGYRGRPLTKRNKTIATNVFLSYRKWKHPYNVSITNHIRLMMELNRKTSLSRVPPEKSYNQMMNILTLAKSEKVILTANVSDGQQFIDKTN